MKTIHNKTTFTVFQLGINYFAVEAFYAHIIPGAFSAYSKEIITHPFTINYCGDKVPVVNLLKYVANQHDNQVVHKKLLMVDTLIKGNFSTICFVIDELLYTNRVISTNCILPPIPVIQDIDTSIILGTIKNNNDFIMLLNIDELNHSSLREMRTNTLQQSVNQFLN